jgi:conjugal transfer pilus assembly protein TraB
MSNEEHKVDETNQTDYPDEGGDTIGVNSVISIRKKQLRKLAIVVATLGGFLCLMYFIISDRNQEAATKKAEQGEFASPIKRLDIGSVLVEKTEAKIAQMEKANQELQKTVTELNQEKEKRLTETPIEQERITTLINRITELEKTLEQSRTVPAGSGNVFPGQPGLLGGQDQAALMTQGIRDDAINLEQSDSLVHVSDKNPQNYVPSGTFVKAITLGGADASAAVNAQSNPQPMLFRIIEDGTMPNNQKSHLKGCLATAAVVGDISSERGFIRLETLSCVVPDTNRIIDLNVEGTVFGPEGKSGIRGTPMWREGALLQRAFAAGALSGVASGVSQKFTNTSISPLGAIQTASGDVKDILAKGAAGGLGNAMEKLADYNIRRAEQYHPVLQLSAGTEVDLVFLKGFYLNDPKNDKIPSRAISNNTEATTSNLNNMSKLTITPDQAEKLKAHTAALNR